MSAARSYSLLLAALAGLTWAAVLALVLFGGLLGADGPLALQRLIFYGLALAAPLLTFMPIERTTGLRGLTLEGTLGTGLLLYTLALVPAPSDWLLALPDLPIYGLLLIAIFLTGAASVRPLIYGLTARLFRERARALDQRRVRRQSYEFGFLLTALAALASLRVLTWVSLLLLVVALLIAEFLFLAWVKTEGVE